MYDSVIQEILCNSPCEFSIQNLQHSVYILSCSSAHLLPKELYHIGNVYLPQILKSSFTCSSTYFMSHNSLKMLWIPGEFRLPMWSSCHNNGHDKLQTLYNSFKHTMLDVFAIHNGPKQYDTLLQLLFNLF